MSGWHSNAAKSELGGRAVPTCLRIGVQVDTFHCLGSHSRVMGDIDESSIHIGDQEHSFAIPITRIQRIAADLSDLFELGLPKHVAGAMLRKYTVAAAQHITCNSFMSDEEAGSDDDAVLDAGTTVLGKTVPNGPLLAVPGKFGGAGTLHARDRHDAAIWETWQNDIGDILEASGHNTASCPNLSDL